MNDYVVLRFATPGDYEKASLINGEILERKNYQATFTSEMYVRAEDADELLERLAATKVPFERAQK